jgi:hypothetical protein
VRAVLLKADKSVSEADKKADKKEGLAQLEAALKVAKPFSSRKTSRWC